MYLPHNETGLNLLNAVLSDPDDDALRLIYADWLEENGEEEQAEFIRIQCELFKHHITPRLVAGELFRCKDDRSYLAIVEQDTVEIYQNLEPGTVIDICCYDTSKKGDFKDCLFVNWMGKDSLFNWHPLHELEAWEGNDIIQLAIQFTHVPGLWKERQVVTDLVNRQYALLINWKPDTDILQVNNTGWFQPEDNKLHRLAFHAVYLEDQQQFARGTKEEAIFIANATDLRHPILRQKLLRYPIGDDRDTDNQKYLTIQFERGFPAEVHLDFHDYIIWGASLIAHHPIQRWLMPDFNPSLEQWDNIDKSTMQRMYPEPVDNQRVLYYWGRDEGPYDYSNFQDSCGDEPEVWRRLYYEMFQNCKRLTELGVTSVRMFGYDPLGLYFLDAQAAHQALWLAMTTLAIKLYNRQHIRHNAPAAYQGVPPRHRNEKFI